MTKLWLVPVAVIGVAVAAGGSTALAEAMNHEQTRTDVSFAGVEAIELDLGAGGAVLTGAPGAEGPTSGTVTGTRVDDRGLTEPKVTEWMDGSTLHLTSRCGSWVSFRCGVHYELTVPAGVRITGSSSGGGLDLRSLAGDVDVSASGGGIDATDTTGPLTLDSSGGGIDITGATGPLTLDSSGGGIDIVESASGSVVATASGGGVSVDLTRSPTVVDLDSSGGGVTLTVPDDGEAYAVDASSSGGDTEVTVDTDQQSDRHVKARSSGGGVTIRYP